MNYEVEVTENIFIPLKDGRRLSARLWRPKTKEKLPAILEYIPYRKNDGTRMRDEPMHGYFAANGFIVYRVDIEGSGESDGLLRDEYLPSEQEDACEVIDYIASQDFCSGSVGMMGKSWGGFNSLQVAFRQPKALKAIITVGFTDDRYNEDIHYKGGCLLNDNFWWGNIMLAYQSRGIDPKIKPHSRDEWLNRLDKMPLWPAQWMQNPLRTAYWKQGSVCEDYSKIRVPVFALDGWADSYTNPVFTLARGLARCQDPVPFKAVVGPWVHVYPHDGIPGPEYDFLAEAVRWWRKYLKGEGEVELGLDVYIENGVYPASTIAQMPGRFVHLDTWDEPEVKIMQLSARGLLGEEVSSHEFSFSTPQTHGLFCGEWMGAGVNGERASDQRMDNALAKCFSSKILEQDLELLGAVAFRAKVKSDQKEGFLYVSLQEQREDGSCQRVAYGLINLAHDENHSKTRNLEASHFYDIELVLDYCGHKFKSGSRILISVANSYWPLIWPSAKQATFTIKDAKISLPLCTAQNIELNTKPERAKNTPHTILQEGHCDRYFTYDLAKDAVSYVTEGVGGVFGEGVYRFDEIDFRVLHNLKRELYIEKNDPLSAKYTITQRIETGREGWQIDADIVLSQTCCEEFFYLKGFMKVYENALLVFEREWDEKIKRVAL